MIHWSSTEEGKGLEEWCITTAMERKPEDVVIAAGYGTMSAKDRRRKEQMKKKRREEYDRKMDYFKEKHGGMTPMQVQYQKQKRLKERNKVKKYRRRKNF